MPIYGRDMYISDTIYMENRRCALEMKPCRPMDILTAIRHEICNGRNVRHVFAMDDSHHSQEAWMSSDS